jgi:hypothetical protein
MHRLTGGPSKRNDLLIACAVTIVCSFISYAVPISQMVALLLVGVAVVLGVLGIGVQEFFLGWLVRQSSRAASGMIGRGNRSSVAQICSDVVDALGVLLRPIAESWDELGTLAKRRVNKQLVDRYKSECRHLVRDAIAQAEMRAAVSVPPEIRRYAEAPRGVNDLLWLRDWLRRVSEDCQPA